jgi:hypothetical protein
MRREAFPLHAVFVAPFFLEATVRFIDAVASVPGVRTGLISQDPLDRLPRGVLRKLDAHRQVPDALNSRQIAEAARDIARAWGGRLDRLIGALEQLQVPLGEVRDLLGVPGLGAETARNFRDKARMKDVLSAAGIPCARHRRVRSGEDVREFIRAVGFPVVLKPLAGAGAKATFRITNPKELEEALQTVRPGPEREATVEEFIQGDEFSFDTVSIQGRPVWHSISYYLPAPLHVVDNPWIQWCVLVPREIDHPKFDDIRHIAFRALQVLGMDTGLSHMEWFRRVDGTPMVSEVGARPPGAQITSLHSYAHDFDLYRAWGRLVTLGEFDPPSRKFAAGCAYLRGQGQGKIRVVRGLEQVLRELGPLVVEYKKPRLGVVPNPSYEGDGYVIVRHPETRVVEQALRHIISQVRVELG